MGTPSHYNEIDEINVDNTEEKVSCVNFIIIQDKKSIFHEILYQKLCFVILITDCIPVSAITPTQTQEYASNLIIY